MKVIKERKISILTFILFITVMIFSACKVENGSVNNMENNDTPEQQDVEQQDAVQKDTKQQDTEQQDTKQQDTEQKDMKQQDIEQQDTKQKNAEQQDTRQKDTENQDAPDSKQGGSNNTVSHMVPTVIPDKEQDNILDVDELKKAYATDGQNPDYTGKEVTIVGILEKTVVEFDVFVSAVLVGDVSTPPVNRVKCYFSYKDNYDEAAKVLELGTTGLFTVMGTCQGLLDNTVILKDCRYVSYDNIIN